MAVDDGVAKSEEQRCEVRNAEREEERLENSA